MSEQNRPMFFYNVGKGSFGVKAQELFMKAQRVACEKNGPVKLVMEQTIYPPASTEERFGQVSYKIKMVEPAIESMKYTTELSAGGTMVADGTNVDELIQTNLFGPENAVPFGKPATGGEAAE